MLSLLWQYGSSEEISQVITKSSPISLIQISYDMIRNTDIDDDDYDDDDDDDDNDADN